MTTAAELASYASSFPSFRNRIINGNFDIWQRGTGPQTSSGYGSADRWFLGHIGSTKTASQQAFTIGQTDVPGNPKYYLRHVVSSVAGTGNYCILDQRIEGVQTLAGQTATVSFWAKADSNKSIATEFVQYFGTGGSPSTQITGIQVVTHNLTTSWQKFTATVAIPSISGKTIGSDGNDLLELIFWFEAGSNYNSRTNSLGQQSGTFDIAQVQVEEGTVATPFEHRPYGTELALCQRYFQALGGSGTNYPLASGFTSTNAFYGQGKLSKTMRSSPSFSVSGTNSHFGYTQVSVGALANATPTVIANPESFHIIVTSSTSTTINAAAYLRIEDPATKAFFDAEL